MVHFNKKKAAINEEYNLKISEATTKGAKKSLEKEKENKLKEVSFEELNHLSILQTYSETLMLSLLRHWLRCVIT